MGDLLLPVGPRRMSSWATHQIRVPKSREPGTDFYCPIGTPVLAPAHGVIYGYGTSITPAEGRWVGIDFDNGQRFRCMHHSRLVRIRGRVARGELIAYSGASGYGKEDWSGDPNTGGSHTHATLWPTQVSRYGYDANGKPYTIDFMKYADLSGVAGGGSTPFPTAQEDDMAYPILVDGKHRMLIAPGYIKHFTDIAASDLTRNIVSAADQWIGLTGAQFALQLDSFGIPRDRVDIATGWVFDVSLGKKVAGGMWSWARDAASRVIPVAPIVIPPIPPAEIDYDAVAEKSAVRTRAEFASNPLK